MYHYSDAYRNYNTSCFKDLPLFVLLVYTLHSCETRNKSLFVRAAQALSNTRAERGRAQNFEVENSLTFCSKRRWDTLARVFLYTSTNGRFGSQLAKFSQKAKQVFPTISWCKG